MHLYRIDPSRAVSVVATMLLAGAVLPALLLAGIGAATTSPWAAFSVGQCLLALGLMRRSRLALVLVQLISGYWLFMGALMPVAMLVVRDGTLVAGYRYTRFYTESPAVVLPLVAVVLLVNYWQWKTLGRADVASLFRKASVVNTPTTRPAG